MRKRITLAGILITSLVLLSAFTVVVNSSGQIFYTDSPFDGGHCGQCHTGGSTPTTLTVTASPAFGAGNTYVPGATYTVNVTVSGNYAKFGFDTEILNSNGFTGVADAGTFGNVVTPNCQKFVFAGNPTNIAHTAPSGTANSATFSFQWTAPSSGPAYIYSSGLGVNANANTSGDRVTTYSVMLSPTVGIKENAPNDLAFTAYPNPASDELQVSYTLEERSQVVVKLLSLKGEMAAVLFNQNQDRGNRSVNCRIPAGLSKGMYLVQLTVNGKDITRKLLVH